ncbi:MAG: amidohydrolase family protein [Planctomycetes bacterium]|nr:amidohydrolase family protein [Planctomycetota bacterium]
MAEPLAAFDLLIRAGRAIGPAAGSDAPVTVAVRGDRIFAIGASVASTAARILNFPDAVLLPGLIDLHAHPAREGSIFGIDPDRDSLPHGVTTMLSQGDAGARNWPLYRQVTIHGSRTRVRLALNLSARGEQSPRGCFANLEDIDVDACVRTIEEDADHLIWGIAVNASHHACAATDPREVLRRALLVAEATGRPLLYGMRRPSDWSFADQMTLLRPGDVVTYCYRREPHCIIEGGRVHSAIRAARTKGVLFDVGHGMASFDFAVAEAALADSFAPDTISTDLQARHLGASPPHTLTRVMAKLRAAGMREADVFAAVTVRPAQIMRLQNEVGVLALGACADLTVLRWNEDPAQLLDAHGASRLAGVWETLVTVRGGQVVRAPHQT